MAKIHSRHLVGFALAALPAMVLAEQLPLTDDTYINQLAPSRNYGDGDTLFVHNWAPTDGLLKFDSSSITGDGIADAELSFRLTSLSMCGTIELHRVTSTWSEDTVTWLGRPSFDASPLASVMVCPADVGEFRSVDVSQLVRGWADGSVPNHGILLRAVGSIKAYIGSKEIGQHLSAQLNYQATGGATTQVPRILDFTKESDCNLDFPGTYLLDRSWNFTPRENWVPTCRTVFISADVTLDMRGFEIQCTLSRVSDCHDPEPVIEIADGATVTIRNGTIKAIENSIYGPSAARVRLENVHSVGYASLNSATILDSSFRYGGNNFDGRILTVAADSAVRDSEFWCEDDPPDYCVTVGNDFEIRDNTFHKSRIYAQANGIIEGNLIADLDITITDRSGIRVADASVVARNVLSGTIHTGLEIAGTGNVVEGNIVDVSGIGVSFGNSGNFFGGNRVSASTSFVGTSGQTDWGGNVSY